MTTREAMTQGTINRLQEHGIQLAQVSAHNAEDFCRYYENGQAAMPPPSRSASSGPRDVIVSIGEEPHPVHPPISAIGRGPAQRPSQLACAPPTGRAGS